MRNLKKWMTVISVITFSLAVPVCAEEEKQNFEIEMAAGEECVILDNEQCIVKVVDVNPEGEWGYTWQVYLENKTDVEMMFDMTDVSINGMMCDPYWAMSVEPGKKANEEIIWDAEELEMYGVNDVTVVEFTLNAYDNDDWEAGNLVYNDYTIYTEGKDAVVLAERQPEATDKVLFENDACSMVQIGFEEDGVWGTELNVYFENKSDMDLMVSFEDVSVNGYMCDPFWGIVVTAGNNAYASISWMEEDLDMNEIEQIEEVQGTMYVYDNDDWEADALVEEQVTINVLE